MEELLGSCEGFDGDKANRLKNWEKHRVSPVECEQVFFNQPLVSGSDETQPKQEPRCFALGRADTGRPLFLVFTVRRKLIRVISARDMSRRERKVYESS